MYILFSWMLLLLWALQQNSRRSPYENFDFISLSRFILFILWQKKKLFMFVYLNKYLGLLSKIMFAFDMFSAALCEMIACWVTTFENSLIYSRKCDFFLQQKKVKRRCLLWPWLSVTWISFEQFSIIPFRAFNSAVTIFYPINN